MNTSTQRLQRSRRDKMVGGVASGIANYLAIDPVIVRLAFVLGTFLHGLGLLVYLVLLVVMPSEPRQGATPSAGGAAGQAFVAGQRKSRFDPMTGEPLNPEEEIPVQNLNSAAETSDTQMRRSWVLGAILVALGAFLILKMLVPAAAPVLIPALLIGAGVWVLNHSRA
jgi:phage shock protein C